MQKFYKLKTLLMVCIMAVLGVGQTWGATFTKVTSESQLVAGKRYLLVYENGKSSAAMGSISSTSTKYGNSVGVTVSSNSINITSEAVNVLTLGGNSSGWTFKASIENKYLFWGSGNSLNAQDDAYNWTISIASGGAATITSTQTTTRSIKYNTGSPRFACYTTEQTTPYLYEEVIEYTVSLAGSPAGTVTGGTISASPTSAAAGTTVSLTATPNAGYVFASWTVTDADAGSVTVTNNQFTMPAKNVTVDATFTVDNTEYDVVVSNETGGIITASPTKAKSGEEVTLTADLDAGYSLVSWIVEDENGDPVATTPVTDKQCTFVMPSSDVSVSAVYKAIYTVSYSVCGIAQTPVQRLDGEQLNLPTPASVNGKAFVGWSTTNDVASPSFVENTAAVTSDLMLYAIYGPKIVYKLVEADQADWRGQYLIAYNSTTFADGRNGGTGGTDTDGMGKQNVKANPDDKLTGKEVDGAWGDTYCVTIEAVDDSDLSKGYLLKTQDGQYNYQTSNSNGLAASSNRATALTYPLSITFNSSSDIDIAISVGAVFHYNTGGYFRFYKDGGQQNVYLYKRTQTGGTEYSLASEVEVPVSAVKYATLYSDVPLTVPTGVEAYTIVVEGDVAKVNDTYAAGDAIAANTAVVIAADADDYTFSVAASGTAPSDNNLMGTVTEETIAADWTNYKYYKLANDATDGIGFYLFNDTNDDFTNGAGKAYLRTSASATVRGFSFADIVSAIERTKAESQHSGAIYDLQGRRVEKPGKGLYIVGGKKVLF